MRPRDTLTPEQQRELEAIDRALSGDPVEYELRELEELVLDVRATAPQMSPAFAARLEHELREGFPAPREQPSRVRLPARRRLLLLPALGSLAAVLVALVFVLGGGDTRELAGGGDSAQTPGAPAHLERESPASRDQPSEPAGGAASSAAAPEPEGGAASSAAAPEPAPSSAGRAFPAPPAVDSTQSARKVQRSATIALETPADEFERATAAVNATVARFGGIVASAQTAQSEAGGEATYDLRIPTSRLDRALAALSRLGHVTEQSQGLQDITSSFTSARARLTDARAERRGLLRALERATTQARVDRLKARLRSVGGQINALKAQLASLRSRAELARVDLTIRGTGDSSGTGGGASWTPGDAAADALRVLEVLAGVLLIALAVLLPAGLLAAVVAAGIRFGRRRRREAALDPA